MRCKVFVQFPPEQLFIRRVIKMKFERLGCLSLFVFCPLSQTLRCHNRIRTNKKRARNYSLNFLPISPYERWETGIVWDDQSPDLITRGRGGWVYQPQDDDGTVARKLQKVMTCQNDEMVSGRWVNGILWDDDAIYTVDLPSSESSDDDDDEEEVEDEHRIRLKRSKRKRFSALGTVIDDHSDDGRTSWCNYDDENITLVNTAEMVDTYLPHHQDEIRKMEMKRKLEEEKRRATQAALAAAASSTTNSSTTSQQSSQVSSASSMPDAQTKGPQYRQQQAREKAERLAKLESQRTPALNSAVNAQSVEESNLNQAAAIRKKKLTASTELEHSTLASRHLTCKVSLTLNELKYYRR
jgi:hypothetical protein